MDHKHDQTTPWKLFPFAGTVIKNLFSKPCTTGYPFEPAQYPERMRGHVEICVEDCISCGLCAHSCPPGALQVDRAAGTWTINRFDCVQCGNCVNVCPKKCLAIVPGYTAPAAQKASETFTPAQGTGCRAGRARPTASRRTMPASAFTAPSAPENVPRTPSRWTALPRPGNWTQQPALAAACAPPPVPRNA